MAEEDGQRLTRMREAIVEAERAGDVAFFAAALDDDAAIMPPDAPAREGKAACLSFMSQVLAGLLDQFDRELTCESRELVVNRPLAFDRGRFFQTLREKDSGLVIRERGHYLWLYRLRDGEWKLSRMIWNGGEEIEDPDGDLAGSEERGTAV